eukprot:364794-Chlamydomonas_euryale.AAC.8
MPCAPSRMPFVGVWGVTRAGAGYADGASALCKSTRRRCVCVPCARAPADDARECLVQEHPPTMRVRALCESTRRRCARVPCARAPADDVRACLVREHPPTMRVRALCESTRRQCARVPCARAPADDARVCLVRERPPTMRVHTSRLRRQPGQTAFLVLGHESAVDFGLKTIEFYAAKVRGSRGGGVGPAVAMSLRQCVDSPPSLGCCFILCI